MLMGALIAAAAAAAPTPAPPVVALMPLRPLGVRADVTRALEVTLRNELSQLEEAHLAPEAEIAHALEREAECEARLSCMAAAALKAGAREVIVGTASQLGDDFMIDLKLVDAKSGAELRRATYPVSGAKEVLIATLREAAFELLAPARFVGGLTVEVPGAAGEALFVDGKAAGTLPLPRPLEGLSPGQHTVRVVDAKSPREMNAFVEVRFGVVTQARLDLGAATVKTMVPAAALPAPQTPASAASNRATWLKPAALATLGAGGAVAIAAIAFHARAYATAADLNRREAQNNLRPSDVQAYRDVDRDTHLARGLYITAAILGVAGGGLLWWDLRADGVGVGGKF